MIASKNHWKNFVSTKNTVEGGGGGALEKNDKNVFPLSIWGAPHLNTRIKTYDYTRVWALTRRRNNDDSCPCARARRKPSPIRSGRQRNRENETGEINGNNDNDNAYVFGSRRAN